MITLKRRKDGKYTPPTAYSFLRRIESYPDGTVKTGLREYDCWGAPKGEMVWRGRLPKGQKFGRFSFVTLELAQAGCCPPALMKDFIEQEGAPKGEDIAIEETIKLHKRGYLGGVG